MAKFDNMGGVISTDFIFPDEIEVFATFANKCTISLINGAAWKKIEMQHQSFTHRVTPKNEDAGKIFTISGSVNLLPQNQYLHILQQKVSIILRYQLTDMNYKVIGTDEYPLSYTVEPLDPGKPSGFRGHKLSFEGKQLFVPPFLNI